MCLQTNSDYYEWCCSSHFVDLQTICSHCVQTASVVKSHFEMSVCTDAHWLLWMLLFISSADCLWSVYTVHCTHTVSIVQSKGEQCVRNNILTAESQWNRLCIDHNNNCIIKIKKLWFIWVFIMHFIDLTNHLYLNTKGSKLEIAMIHSMFVL